MISSSNPSDSPSFCAPSSLNSFKRFRITNKSRMSWNTQYPVVKNNTERFSTLRSITMKQVKHCSFFKWSTPSMISCRLHVLTLNTRSAVNQMWMTEYCCLNKWVLFQYERLPQNALVRMKSPHQGHAVIMMCVCVSRSASVNDLPWIRKQMVLLVKKKKRKGL